MLSCQTRLIIVDDVHFLDMNRRDGREVANHFKWLQSQFPVTFLFVGVGILERQMLTEGLGPADAALAQTARRWTALSLSPFEIATDQGRRTWRRLLLAIERDLVLSDAHQGMLADQLADYLYARSTGHFASLMTLDQPRLLARDPHRHRATDRRAAGPGPQRRGGRAGPPGTRSGLRARAAHHARERRHARRWRKRRERNPRRGADPDPPGPGPRRVIRQLA